MFDDGVSANEYIPVGLFLLEPCEEFCYFALAGFLIQVIDTML